MKLKATICNATLDIPPRDLELSSLGLLQAACKDLKIDEKGLTYYGFGIWEVPGLSVEGLEAMSADLCLMSTPGVFQQVFLEDAYGYLEKAEDDSFIED